MSVKSGWVALVLPELKSTKSEGERVYKVQSIEEKATGEYHKRASWLVDVKRK
jgi:hypothetical protein